jgi:hypothetical protein
VTATDLQTAPTEPAPDHGETLNLLGNDRRLRVVHSLVESDEPTTTKALATRIAEAEAEQGDVIADDVYKSVYVSLQQTHLPKLADHGIVSYDPDTNTVGPGPRLDEARVYVTPHGHDPAPPPPTLVLASGVGLMTVAAARFGVPVVSAVEPAVWAALALLAVLVVVVTRRGRRDSTA